MQQERAVKQNFYREESLVETNVMAQQSDESFFAGIDHLAQYERQAKSQGLTFSQELKFENGAIYKGYL